VLHSFILLFVFILFIIFPSFFSWIIIFNIIFKQFTYNSLSKIQIDRNIEYAVLLFILNIFWFLLLTIYHQNYNHSYNRDVTAGKVDVSKNIVNVFKPVCSVDPNANVLIAKTTPTPPPRTAPQVPLPPLLLQPTQRNAPADLPPLLLN
jgi:hypothetical protein